jgi:hypothetical protein
MPRQGSLWVYEYSGKAPRSEISRTGMRISCNSCNDLSPRDFLQRTILNRERERDNGPKIFMGFGSLLCARAQPYCLASAQPLVNPWSQNNTFYRLPVLLGCITYLQTLTEL